VTRDKHRREDGILAVFQLIGLCLALGLLLPPVRERILAADAGLIGGLVIVLLGALAIAIYRLVRRPSSEKGQLPPAIPRMESNPPKLTASVPTKVQADLQLADRVHSDSDEVSEVSP